MAVTKVKPTILGIARRYKHTLEKRLPIEQIILFGSQAKGTAKPWSDIDICVVSPKLGKDRHQERVMLSRFTDDIDWRLEPHPYNPKDLQDKWDSLASEILRTGIPV